MDDGRLNVGVGLLTVSKRYKGFNTTKLMESFLPSVPPYWGVSKNSACDAPMGGRLQMGLSITPRVGVSHLLIGDSVGAINPFNGEGISYAFETGRMAAEVLNEALSSKSSSPFILHEYEQNLINAYEAYYKIGKAFVNLISRPEIMRVLVANGMHSNKIMEEVLTVMANLLDPIKTGPAEFIYKLLSSATNLIGTPAH
jgi:flavin-dependent dehydrogenase